MSCSQTRSGSSARRPSYLQQQAAHSKDVRAIGRKALITASVKLCGRRFSAASKPQRASAIQYQIAVRRAARILNPRERLLRITAPAHSAAGCHSVSRVDGNVFANARPNRSDFRLLKELRVSTMAHGPVAGPEIYVHAQSEVFFLIELYTQGVTSLIDEICAPHSSSRSPSPTAILGRHPAQSFSKNCCSNTRAYRSPRPRLK